MSRSSLLCVCSRAYIRYCSRTVFIKFVCLLPMAVARCSSGGFVIRSVLPVLWTMPCLCTMAGKATRNRRIRKVTRRGAARIWHRGVYSDWPTRGSTGAGAEYAICAIALCLQLEAASHRCISRLCCRHRRSVGVDEGNTLLSHSLVWHHIMYVQLPQLMMPWQLHSDTSRLGTCVNNVTRVAVHLSRLSATPLDTACTSHAHLQTYQLVTSARAATPRAQRDNVACCYRPTGVVCLSVCLSFGYDREPCKNG